MYPKIIFLGKTFGSYSIMAVLGLIVSGFVGARLAKKKYDIIPEQIILFVTAVTAGILVGGHLLYGLLNAGKLWITLKELFSTPFGKTFQRFQTVFGGSVFYGGLFGCLVAALIYTRYSKNLKRYQAFDLLGVTIPLFHAFGRIGCFLGGCCYGVESSFGFASKENEFVPEVVGVTRFPVQLVESFCNFLIFIIIFCLFKKNIAEKRLIFVYLALYPPVRFTLEFFRGDTVRGIFFGLATSQWVSLFILFALAVYFTVNTVKKKKKQNLS